MDCGERAAFVSAGRARGEVREIAWAFKDLKSRTRAAKLELVKPETTLLNCNALTTGRNLGY